jgi:hypothetical protein
MVARSVHSARGFTGTVQGKPEAGVIAAHAASLLIVVSGAWGASGRRLGVLASPVRGSNTSGGAASATGNRPMVKDVLTGELVPAN